MRRLAHDDLKHRVIDAAKVLNSEIERYRKSVHQEIEFKKRLLDIESDESLQREDLHMIKSLRSSIPEQLSIQLKRWLKSSSPMK